MKIHDDLDRLHALINRRAWEIFFRPDAHTGTPLDNLVRAKYEVETCPELQTRGRRGVQRGAAETPPDDES
jgi:hypothetical protein